MSSYTTLNIDIRQLINEEILTSSTSAPEGVVNDVTQNGDSMFSSSMLNNPEYNDYIYFN